MNPRRIPCIITVTGLPGQPLGEPLTDRQILDYVAAHLTVDGEDGLTDEQEHDLSQASFQVDQLAPAPRVEPGHPVEGKNLDDPVEPMPERCTVWPCTNSPFSSRLVERDGYMVCPLCELNYGAAGA